MKGLLLPLLLAALLCSCNSTKEDNGSITVTDEEKAIIEFDNNVHDFGSIEEGEIVACVFTFKNSGKGDLLINSATTSCGCTVPKFEDKPIPPGKSGSLEVVFDSSYRQGAQNKTITVRSNAEKPIVILKIKAEVITNN